MPWAKLDDAIFVNPKVTDLSQEAKLTYLVSIAYCARELTDGRITNGSLRLITAQASMEAMQRCGEVAKELHEAGLWDSADGCYWVHDYLEYNPTREQVLKDRDAAKERMRRHRSGEVRANVQPKFERSSETPESRFPDPKTESKPLPPPAKRATRLEENWNLPEDWRGDAVNARSDVDPDLEALKFLDYWVGKPGRDGKKLDWRATWRNWIRNAQPTKTYSPRGSPDNDPPFVPNLINTERRQL